MSTNQGGEVNWQPLVTNLLRLIKYIEKQDRKRFDKQCYLIEALKANDLKEAERLVSEMNGHSDKIALHAEEVCERAIIELLAVSGVIEGSESSAADQDVLPNREAGASCSTDVSPTIEEKEHNSTSTSETEFKVTSADVVPDNSSVQDKIGNWFRGRGGWSKGFVTSTSESQEDEDAAPKLEAGLEEETLTIYSPLAKRQSDQPASILESAEIESIESQHAEIATAVPDGYLKVDKDDFIKLIHNLDNNPENKLIAAIDVPILRLVQSLYDLSFTKGMKGTQIDLHQNLKQLAFNFLSILGPLPALNSAFGAYLKAEATEMQSMVDMTSGIGSIISYCEKKVSTVGTCQSEEIDDMVFSIKDAIHRAKHGNVNDQQVLDESRRSFINAAVKDGTVKRHLALGHETTNLLMHLLSSYFGVAFLRKLSIFEIVQYLSCASTFMQKLDDFVQRVNPNVDFDDSMNALDFLLTHVVLALEEEETQEEAWEIACSVLCYSNKPVSVGPNASDDAKAKDPRKEKFDRKYREVECEAKSGGVDESAAVYWSGSEDKHQVRRLRAFREVAIILLRTLIEKSCPTDSFTKFGYTRSFLLLSVSSIGKECTFIRPKMFSSCRAELQTKISKMMKALDKKDDTGVRTLFVQGDEQRDSLKLLLDAYDTLTSEV